MMQCRAGPARLAAMAAPELTEAGIMHVRRQPHIKRAGAGWLAVVAILLVMSAAFMALLGILALADDYYWGGDTLVSGHRILFGWLYLACVPVELTAALLIVVDHPFGAVMGIFIALCSGFLHLILIPSHPIAMGVFLAVDLFVIVVLAVYGFGAVKVVQPGTG
jgi:hypothetical protein